MMVVESIIHSLINFHCAQVLRIAYVHFAPQFQESIGFIWFQEYINRVLTDR